MTGFPIRPTRRGLLGTAAALGAGAPAGPALAQSLRGTTLVFASWGGAYQEAQKVCYCEPFAAETGARVVQDLSLIHISEPTRQAEISYAVFCLKKKKQKIKVCPT